MRIYTITIAIEDDPCKPEEANRDWDQVAKAARLVAHHVTSDGLPIEGQATLVSGVSVRVFLSAALDLAIEPEV